MAEIVCRRCGESRPGMEQAPLPGRWGPLVLAQTCPECWRAWVEEQTRVINHEGLVPGRPEDRQVLYARMQAFLKLA